METRIKRENWAELKYVSEKASLTLLCSAKPWNAPSKEGGFLGFLRPGLEDEEGVHGGEAMHRALDGDRKPFHGRERGVEDSQAGLS